MLITLIAIISVVSACVGVLLYTGYCTVRATEVARLELSILVVGVATMSVLIGLLAYVICEVNIL